MSLVSYYQKFEDFSSVSNLVLCHVLEWFEANKLVLNLEKTNIIKFVTLNSPLYTMTTGYKDKYTKETVYITFLGLQIDS
jgi:hypothetical protein